MDGLPRFDSASVPCPWKKATQWCLTTLLATVYLISLILIPFDKTREHMQSFHLYLFCIKTPFVFSAPIESFLKFEVLCILYYHLLLPIKSNKFHFSFIFLSIYRFYPILAYQLHSLTHQNND